LIDSWNLPIKPGNLRAERLRQGEESSDWYRVLTVGINGTPMPVFGEALTPEQRWEIVAYLQELRSQPVEAKK
jgi:mono/diheme cytochrome c family protein